jgi:serine O-acetyltransferase
MAAGLLTGEWKRTTGESRFAVACQCYPVARAGGTRVLGLMALLAEDLDAVLVRDPACSGRFDALMHAGWQGLMVYRIAHRLYERGHRVIPVILTKVGRVVSGMDVHPGARLGRRAFIDHGFGVVIGQTCVIGDDVTIYHQVTLGSRGWWQDGGRGAQRHPTIGDRVKIGTGASVLGPVTIDDDLQIRAHQLVLRDLPEDRSLQ